MIFSSSVYASWLNIQLDRWTLQARERAEQINANSNVPGKLDYTDPHSKVVRPAGHCLSEAEFGGVHPSLLVTETSTTSIGFLRTSPVLPQPAPGV